MKEHHCLFSSHHRGNLKHLVIGKKSVHLISAQGWVVIHLEVSDKSTEIFFPRKNYWFYRKYSVNNTPEYTVFSLNALTIVALHDEPSNCCPQAGGSSIFSNINCINCPGHWCWLLSNLFCSLLPVAALTHFWHHISCTAPKELSSFFI